MEVYQIENICEAFRAACEHFEYLVCELQSKETGEMEHGQVEAFIRKEGMELLRRLFQGHLDVRAIREERKREVIGVDEKVRTHCRKDCERDLMSVFGEVVVRRKGYSAPGVGSLFPLDKDLNLPPDKYSEGLRRRVAEEVAGNSFDDAVAHIEKTTGGRVPKRQVEQIAESVSQDFEAFYAGDESPGVEETSTILVMSVDGKGVVMRHEDLRPATRKAAEEAEQPSAARLVPGQKPNRKRMATVAAVYDIEPHERTPEQIMDGEKKSSSVRPRARNKRVWASVEQDSVKVIESMFEEALRRDPDRKHPWAILVDGGEQQLKHILDLIKYYGVYVTLVLDFIHVLEYVWKAAYGFYAVGSKEAEDWVAEQALEILQGKADSVAETMLERASGLSPGERKPIEKCADYLTNYAPIMEYDEYLSEGLPIATGVIEGACRHLIKDRMDRTGARWRLRGAEAVLKIRSLRSSGDLDEYWTFHRARERERNHSSRYAPAPRGPVVVAQNHTSDLLHLEEAA